MRRPPWSLAGPCIVLIAAVAAGHPASLAGDASAQSARDAKLESRALEKKVDQVLANQQLILQKLDAMMEELRVIKVRATHS